MLGIEFMQNVAGDSRLHITSSGPLRGWSPNRPVPITTGSIGQPRPDLSMRTEYPSWRLVHIRCGSSTGAKASRIRSSYQVDSVPVPPITQFRVDLLGELEEPSKIDKWRSIQWHVPEMIRDPCPINVQG